MEVTTSLSHITRAHGTPETSRGRDHSLEKHDNAGEGDSRAPFSVDALPTQMYTDV